MYVRFEPYVRFHTKVSLMFMWLGGRLLGVAACSACGVFSESECLIVDLVFPTSVFGVVLPFKFHLFPLSLHIYAPCAIGVFFS